MENKKIELAAKDHPGVYIPPPLIYVATFFASVFFQQRFPLDHSWFAAPGIKIGGVSLIASGVLLLGTSFWRFLISKNTLIPIKPAVSLQTSGVYSISRNPMYLGLLLIYCGIAIFKGNLWTFMLTPIVVLIIQAYVIKKEEQYLIRAFGEKFVTYTKKVRRWI